ncbi:prepilin-type N-terminal cleavage/methylation domain-containing protein [Picosynechococcus sp. NKBG042902]|uniref:prepilin-type N-terminal cleavage/methylation domain-containing protein n=1 Tax=Picosynechococcus sp. NKBG042902 TaxID=490193 RepID=UPI0004AA95E0|nr:prepilin-type N-terminal cleavage/methylation domain-containing protein [Picosynechococcus sp. NKBG042902]
MRRWLLKYYFNLLNRRSTSQGSRGFTVTEVLLAITLSGIVAAGLGTAMVATLNASNRTEARTQRRSQLNRAIDYITEDVRRSRVLSVGTTDNEDDTLVLKYFPTTGDNASSRTIEYSIAEKDANSPWVGPMVLRRRDYRTGDDPSNWTVLVDAISENTSLTIDCASGTAIGNAGFRACLEVGTSATGNDVFKVDLALYGEVNDFDGSNNTSEVLSVNSAAFARSLSPEGGFLKNPSITSVTLSSDLTTATVNWSEALGGTQPYSYTLYRCSEGPDTCAIDIATSDTVASSLTTTTYTDNISSLSQGNTVCYAVKVTDAEGDIGTSNPVCVEIVDELIPPQIEDIWESQGEVGLEWQAASGGDPGYLYGLKRCDVAGNADDCDPTTLVRDPEIADTSYFPDPLTGISDGQKICYAVVVKDQAGGEAQSDPKCIIKGQALSAPPIKTITEQADNTVDLTWLSASGGDYPYTYDLLRCVSPSILGIINLPDCTPTTPLNLATQDKSFSGDNIAAVTSGSKICYAVQVTDSSAATSIGATECLVKDAPLTAPDSLTVTLDVSSAEMDITWPNATGGTPDYTYNLYRCDTTNSSCTPSLLTSDVTSVHADSVSGIARGRNVCYAVQVSDADGTTAQTETVCETKIDPLLLSGLVVTIDPDASEANIAWSSITGGSTASPTYNLSLKRCTGENCTPTTARSTRTTQNTGSGSFTDSVSGIAEGTNICYAIDVTDGTQTTSRQTCTTLETSLAAPVISLTNTPSDIRPTINWPAVTGATSYRVFSCQQGLNCDSLSGSTTNTTNRSFTPSSDPGVGNQWCFAVKATKGSVISPASDQVCSDQRGLSQPTINSVSISKANGNNVTPLNVSIAWFAPEGGSLFDLFYCTGSTCSLPGTPQRQNIAASSFSENALVSGNKDALFCFGIRAKQSGLTSDMSGRVCVQAGGTYNNPNPQ